MIRNVWELLSKVLLVFTITSFISNALLHCDAQDNSQTKHTSVDLECMDGVKRSIQVCATTLEPGGDEKTGLSMLLFNVCGQEAKVLIHHRLMTTPDANITYMLEHVVQIPVFREDVSGRLDVFYFGNFVFLNETFPFSGEQNDSAFKGRVFYVDAVLEMACNKIVISAMLNSSSCFLCDVISSHVDPPLTSVSSLDAYEGMLHNSEKLSPAVKFHKVDTSYEPFRRQERDKVTNEASQPLTCYLHVVADHLFFKYVGNGNVMETINSIFRTVNGADAIFRSTDFNGDFIGENIGFVVGEVTVYKTEHDSNYKMKMPYMTSDEYLQQFSSYNFEKHCLAVAFTYRDFQGVSGSAYRGYSNPTLPGGICQGRIKGTDYNVSLNTLVITFLASGKTVKLTSAALTLAHELGHSMGASHEECQTSSKHLGGYIMSKDTHLDVKPNNQRFSRCSIRAMAPVIRKKGTCLQPGVHEAHCGNSVLDVGEECDCGHSSICNSIDSCCTPSDLNGNPDKPCTTQTSKGKDCSPRLSPCCSTGCEYKKQKTLLACNIFDECTQKSYCNGQSQHCPEPQLLPNGSQCNEGRRLCEGNLCVVDVCSYHGLDPCTCSEAKDTCKLCCRNITCTTSDTYGIKTTNGSQVLLEPGTPCAPGKYCDSMQTCVAPNQQRTHLKFGDTDSFESFMSTYWLYCLFLLSMIIFLVSVVIASFIKSSKNIKTLQREKLQSICDKGDQQLRILNNNISDVHKHYEESLLMSQKQADLFGSEKYFSKTVARLGEIFPDASIQQIEIIVKISSSEREAVQTLLLQGFQIRPLNNLSLHSTDTISSTMTSET